MNKLPQKKSVSVVIPVYNEEQALAELIEKLHKVFRPTDYLPEIIVVDDGSTDGSPAIADQISRKQPNVRLIRLFRNRGKAAALKAGFDNATGDYVATIDADLQDDPEAIPRMITLLESQNLDLVSGWKHTRRDRFIKRQTSKLFNFFTRVMTGVKLHDMNNGLKVYRSEVVKSIDLYGEMHRFIPVLAKIKGFTSGELKVRHFPRKYGRTKYGVSRFYKGFLDLLTVLFTMKFMKRPMHFFGLWGILFLFIGILAEGYLLVLKYAFREPFQKHIALLILGVLLIVFGMQFISLGLISEMIIYHRKDKSR